MTARFVLILRPEGGPSKRVECPITVKAVKGAKQHASQWAADVGERGTIDLFAHDFSVSSRVAVATVRNSRITGWV